MITEKEAWLDLATQWSSAQLNTIGNYAVIDSYGNLDDDGLCCSVDSLYDLNKINEDIRRKMLNKIRKQKREVDNCAYKWPLTKEGAEKRVEFCLKQYKEIPYEPKLISKITPGFVEQIYDLNAKRWISQEFYADYEVRYEDENGQPFESDELFGCNAPYLPFNLEQPKNAE